MFANGRIWLAYLIVFVSSTCTLVIELVAGRIMAPFIGVSLYTWTSIIGIVLAGMSLGNYLGGLVADRRASRATLGLIFVAAGLATVGILAMTAVVFAAQVSLPLIPRIVLFTTAIFFLPSLVLGMVSPVVVKLALRDLQRTGGTVGTIYAFSTVGSIFGTFLTGFYLISALGTRTIIWVVAATLLLMGVLVGGFWRPKARLAALLGALLASGAAVWANASGTLVWAPTETAVALTRVGPWAVLILPLLMLAGCAAAERAALPATVLAFATFGLLGIGWQTGLYLPPCEIESNYFCIRTTENTVDGQKVRALVLDHLIHSYVSLEDPKFLGYGYERVYAEVTQYYAADHRELDTLFIGGGGYTFPKYVEAVYPQSTIDVIEIDPAVTEAAHNLLNLPRDTRIRSFNEDARTFLISWPEPKLYDVVYGDAFNDLSVPYHLTTVEFDRLVAARLKPDGIYMVNVIDKFQGGEFVKAFLSSLRQVFPHVYLLSQGETWGGSGANTYILMASRQPFDEGRFRAAAVASGQAPVTNVLPHAELDAYLASGRPIILTDDYVPVDQLVARLFVERGY